MNKTKLTLTVVTLLMSTVTLIAEPIMMNYTSAPEPVEGMEVLQTKTNYPNIPSELRDEGVVILKFHVDVIGNVSNIEVAQSAGELLDETAIAAVQKTDWNPAMQNGKAIPVNFQLPFQFRSK